MIVACAFIHQKFYGVEKVFLPKRASTKKFLPGVYELPGGHIEYGEDIVDGLKREIREELGMEISVGDPFTVFTSINHVKNAQYIEVVYFAKFEGDIKSIHINPEDHSEFEWFAETDIQKVIDTNRIEEDPEVQAIKKGFAVLRGEPLR